MTKEQELVERVIVDARTGFGRGRFARWQDEGVRALAEQRDEAVALLRRCVARLDHADRVLREENEGPYEEEATYAADIADVHVFLVRIGAVRA